MTHLYVCANSTLNFFIYYVNGKRFRRAWKKKFGCWHVLVSRVRSRKAGGKGGQKSKNQQFYNINSGEKHKMMMIREIMPAFFVKGAPMAENSKNSKENSSSSTVARV